MMAQGSADVVAPDGVRELGVEHGHDMALGAESAGLGVDPAIAGQQWRPDGLNSCGTPVFLVRHPKAWGPTAWVTPDLDAFRRAVWGTRGCAVFWDESSDSLDRNVRKDKKFFTRIRHEHSALFVLMHDFTVLTPLMRGNLSDAFIFRQMDFRAADWASLFTDRDLLQADTLQKREFLHKTAFCPVTRHLPTLAELGRLDFIP